MEGGTFHSLCHRLIDNIGTQLGQTPDIGFTRAKVAPFLRVLKEAKNCIAVIAVVLGRVNSPLGGNTMRTAWTILETKALDIIAHSRHRCGSQSTSEAGSHDYNFIFGTISRSDETDMIKMGLPFLCNRTGWDLSIEFHSYSVTPAVIEGNVGGGTTPQWTKTGTEQKPISNPIAETAAKARRARLRSGLSKPRV